MIRGRRADSAAVQEAKGNPGKRRARQQAATLDQPSLIDPAAPGLAAADAGEVKLFAPLPSELSGGSGKTKGRRAAAAKVWAIVGRDLWAIGFLKRTDFPMFARYCKALSDYWDVTRQLDADKDGHTYWTDTNHGKMRRVSPLFLIQDRLERRLMPMEDRLGISPAARQSVLYRLSSGGAVNPTLPTQAPGGAQAPQQPDQPATGDQNDPIGILSSEATGRVH